MPRVGRVIRLVQPRGQLGQLGVEFLLSRREFSARSFESAAVAGFLSSLQATNRPSISDTAAAQSKRILASSWERMVTRADETRLDFAVGEGKRDSPASRVVFISRVSMTHLGNSEKAPAQRLVLDVILPKRQRGNRFRELIAEVEGV